MGAWKQSIRVAATPTMAGSTGIFSGRNTGSPTMYGGTIAQTTTSRSGTGTCATMTGTTMTAWMPGSGGAARKNAATGTGMIIS